MRRRTVGLPNTIDPYDVLGLERSADAEAIRKAYFALVREHPPERDPEAFKRIRAAYERIRTPEQRLETDMLLWEDWSDPAPSRDETFVAAVDPVDVIEAVRALTDLGRTDWREEQREVKL